MVSNLYVKVGSQIIVLHKVDMEFIDSKSLLCVVKYRRINKRGSKTMNIPIVTMNLLDWKRKSYRMEKTSEST